MWLSYGQTILYQGRPKLLVRNTTSICNGLVGQKRTSDLAYGIADLLSHVGIVFPMKNHKYVFLELFPNWFRDL